MKVDVRVVREKRHRDARIWEPLRDHQGTEPQTERIVMVAWMPDRDFFGLPCFARADGGGFGWHQRDIAAAARAGVLSDRYWMQLHKAGAELAVFCRRRRGVFVFACARERVVERPVLDLALPALHDDTANIVVALAVGFQVAAWKMQVLFRDAEAFVDPVEAEFLVCFGKRERMVRVHGLAVDHPLIHPPEMGVVLLEIDPEGVDHLRHNGELLSRPDWSADASWIVRRALPPGVDVFQRLGGVELLHRVIEVDCKTGAREALEFLLIDPRGIGEEFGFECRVIPPGGSEFTDWSWHGILGLSFEKICNRIEVFGAEAQVGMAAPAFGELVFSAHAPDLAAHALHFVEVGIHPLRDVEPFLL